MISSRAILSSIKTQILSVVPDAEILLFGSRAYGAPTKESDWDILVLTDQPVNRAIKNEIHRSIFPISVKIGAFINTLTVQKDDWENNPSYYPLHQTIKNRMVQA
jgi:predicted nucleotidyltransferase